MKKKDLMVIIGVAIVSAIFSYVLAGYLFGGENAENLKAPIVAELSSEFNTPADDDPYYNAQAINPTVKIDIGDSDNQQPF